MKTRKEQTAGKAPLSLLAATTTALLLLTGCMPYGMAEERKQEKAESRQVLVYDEEQSNFSDFLVAPDGYVYIKCTLAVKNQSGKKVTFWLLPDFTEDEKLAPQRYGFTSKPCDWNETDLAGGDFVEFRVFEIGSYETREYTIVYKMLHGSVNTRHDREPPHGAVLIIKSMEG